MKYLLSFLLLCRVVASAQPERPHLLWLSSEDHGPQMGCYGDAYATTPHIDQLAARGLLYKHVWAAAPVCAPSRTTIITGLFSPSAGAEHMRSEVKLPPDFKLFPEHLRQAGYYCSNNSKEDYNLTKTGQPWDESSPKAHWKNRAAHQPFFAVFNATASHESQLRNLTRPLTHDPAKARVPAYHPDTPEVRADWARYYDTVSAVDAEAGRHLRELADAGLAEDTIVFYWADHGSGMPRSKRWPSNSGLHVPLVVYFPAKWRHLAPKDYAPGAQSDRLVSFVDFAPTMLSLAGLPAPAWMQGHAFAGPFAAAPQPFLHGFRGRMDERIDLVRSVTDGRYVYLRNYLPHRSQGQHVHYQFETATTRLWWEQFVAGRTNAAQSLFWQTPKAPEELYDLTTDPDEVRNLATDPAHQAILQTLRQAQQTQARRIRDTGFLSEAEVHERAGATAPYTMGHDPQRYDFDRIFAVAELASALQPDATPTLIQYLGDADSAVRYWGASGLLMRGPSAVAAGRAALTAALHDASISVRIVAAEALGRYGDAADLTAALATLREAADPTKTNAYFSTAALNAIDALGPRAAPLIDFIQTLPTRDPHAPARVGANVATLRADFLKALRVEPVVIPEAKGKKGNKSAGSSAE